MEFDPNKVYKLRDDSNWKFLRNGIISNNIVIGLSNNKILCLFKNGKYRMDGKQHNKDIIND